MNLHNKRNVNGYPSEGDNLICILYFQGSVINGWMTESILRPFQQYFSHIRTMGV